MAKARAGSAGSPGCWEDGHRCAICNRCRSRASASGGRRARTRSGVTMSDARSEILARIKRATATAVGGSWEEIPRSYRRSSEATCEDLISLLTHRLNDYDAQVLKSSDAAASTAVAGMLKARGISRIVVPPGLQAFVVAARLRALSRTPHLSHAELNQYEKEY